jgi:hypothetical protein
MKMSVSKMKMSTGGGKMSAKKSAPAKKAAMKKVVGMAKKAMKGGKMSGKMY